MFLSYSLRDNSSNQEVDVESSSVNSCYSIGTFVKNAIWQYNPTHPPSKLVNGVVDDFERIFFQNLVLNSKLNTDTHNHFFHVFYGLAMVIDVMIMRVVFYSTTFGVFYILCS